MHWQYLQVRSQLIRALREFLWAQNFVEVDTPLLVARPGQEPYLQPFATTLARVDGQKYTGYLITSPEYALKKLLARAANGEAPEFAKIFQLSHVFRNGEDFGGTHNPEFMMLEWYRLGEDYNSLMNDTEAFVCKMVEQMESLERFRRSVCVVVRPTAEDLETKTPPAPQLTYQGRVINLQRPWPRMTVVEAFEKFAGRNDALELAKNTEEFFEVFLKEVEPKIRELNTPLHLIDYPASQAALARRKPADPRVAERVETYIAGLELTNGFSELTDAVEQRARFEQEQKERAAAGHEPIVLDEEFLAALPQISAAAGMSLGVDRLIMLLLDAKDINDVLFWPARDLFEV